jgi:NitT/TauT family transport system ATP-binding protein
MVTKTGAPETEPLDFSEPASSDDEAFRNEPAGATGVSVSIEGLGHRFGALVALEGVGAEVTPGTVLGVVGPSGCGKSTLLELIAGLREPSEGRISIGGESSPARRLARCAYMPQRDLLLPWLRAIDNAALALRVAGRSRSEARRAAWPLFERFGLSGFELARPDELSGGMRQRVAFLRTLMAGKPVLLLDEPFASLDAITRAEMQSWLAGVLEPDRHTVMLVTHDVEEALYLSDRVLVLTRRPGRIAAEIELPEPRAADRAAAVTSSRFAELKQRALRALAGEA